MLSIGSHQGQNMSHMMHGKAGIRGSMNYPSLRRIQMDNPTNKHRGEGRIRLNKHDRQIQGPSKLSKQWCRVHTLYPKTVYMRRPYTVQHHMWSIQSRSLNESASKTKSGTETTYNWYRFDMYLIVQSRNRTMVNKR